MVEGDWRARVSSGRCTIVSITRTNAKVLLHSRAILFTGSIKHKATHLAEQLNTTDIIILY